MLWGCQAYLVATMRPFKTIPLFCAILRLSAIALGANSPILRPAQLPDLSLSLNLTSLYDNETSLTSPSSNNTSLYENLTSLALPLSNTSLLPNNLAPLTDSQLPRDPTVEHYAYATISYFGYGARLNIAAVDQVFEAALSDCRRHSFQSRMGTNTRIYTEGSVSLMLNPAAWTYWLTWVRVRERLVAFATEYGYPAFGFTISHPESGAPLGSGSIRSIQPNNLPPSPYYMQFSDSAGVVKFYNYGAAIDMYNTLRSILEATIHCSHYPANETIDAAKLIYPEGSVALTLDPGRLMNWGEWREVLNLIKRFLGAYEYVSFSFDVANEKGDLGNGDLKKG